MNSFLLSFFTGHKMRVYDMYQRIVCVCVCQLLTNERGSKQKLSPLLLRMMMLMISVRVVVVMMVKLLVVVASNGPPMCVINI